MRECRDSLPDLNMTMWGCSWSPKTNNSTWSRPTPDPVCVCLTRLLWWVRLGPLKKWLSESCWPRRETIRSKYCRKVWMDCYNATLSLASTSYWAKRKSPSLEPTSAPNLSPKCTKNVGYWTPKYLPTNFGLTTSKRRVRWEVWSLGPWSESKSLDAPGLYSQSIVCVETWFYVDANSTS